MRPFFPQATKQKTDRCRFAGNPGLVLCAFRRSSRIDFFLQFHQKRNLDIGITCNPKRAGDFYYLAHPGPVVFVRETGFKKRQCCAQPAGCYPHAVDMFYILGCFDTGISRTNASSSGGSFCIAYQQKPVRYAAVSLAVIMPPPPVFNKPCLGI